MTKKGGKQRCDTLIRDGYILTMDSQRRVFPNGAIAIDGPNIVGAGPQQDIISKFQANAAGVMDAARQDEIIEKTWKLDELKNIGEYMRLLV